MEFFQEVHHPGLAIPRLKQSLTIENLPNLCASISTAAPRSESEGELYCLWGSFSVRRDEIRNGVRYALVECPHALAWTVTLDEAREHARGHGVRSCLLPLIPMQKNKKNKTTVAGLICLISSTAIIVFPPAKFIALISFIWFLYLTWIEHGEK